MQAELSQAEWSIAEDKMSVSGSVEMGLAQDVVQGSTSKQTFTNCTFRCNSDLMLEVASDAEVRPEDSCQTEDDHVRALPRFCAAISSRVSIVPPPIDTGLSRRNMSLPANHHVSLFQCFV